MWSPPCFDSQYLQHTHACTHMYMYTHIHIHTYTHMYTCAHTHSHTHTRVQSMFKGLAPVSGGFGMKMMKKMGWEEGCPLGRSGQGLVEPIEVEIKMNRRGEYLPGHALVLFSVCTEQTVAID